MKGWEKYFINLEIRIKFKKIIKLRWNNFDILLEFFQNDVELFEKIKIIEINKFFMGSYQSHVLTNHFPLKLCNKIVKFLFSFILNTINLIFVDSTRWNISNFFYFSILTSPLVTFFLFFYFSNNLAYLYQ